MAKQVVAEERQERKKSSNDEEHLVVSRCESSEPFILVPGRSLKV
jgi:hypothetical protein